MEEAIQEFEKLVSQYPNEGLILEYNPYCPNKWMVVSKVDYSERYLLYDNDLSYLITKLWKLLKNKSTAKSN